MPQDSSSALLILYENEVNAGEYLQTPQAWESMQKWAEKTLYSVGIMDSHAFNNLYSTITEHPKLGILGLTQKIPETLCPHPTFPLYTAGENDSEFLILVEFNHGYPRTRTFDFAVPNPASLSQFCQAYATPDLGWKTLSFLVAKNITRSARAIMPLKAFYALFVADSEDRVHADSRMHAYRESDMATRTNLLSEVVRAAIKAHS